jgi:hypothetical protein
VITGAACAEAAVIALSADADRIRRHWAMTSETGWTKDQQGGAAK